MVRPKQPTFGRDVADSAGAVQDFLQSAAHDEDGKPLQSFGPIMTTKQVKKAYLNRTRGPKMTKEERRRQELAELARIKREEQELKKQREKERASNKARMAREKKKAKEEQEKAEKRKQGLPLVSVHPSQDMITRFFRDNRKSKKRKSDGTLVAPAAVEQSEDEDQYQSEAQESAAESEDHSEPSRLSSRQPSADPPPPELASKTAAEPAPAALSDAYALESEPEDDGITDADHGHVDLTTEPGEQAGIAAGEIRAAEQMDSRSRTASPKARSTKSPTPRPTKTPTPGSTPKGTPTNAEQAIPGDEQNTPERRASQHSATSLGHEKSLTPRMRPATPVVISGPPLASASSKKSPPGTSVVDAYRRATEGGKSRLASSIPLESPDNPSKRVRRSPADRQAAHSRDPSPSRERLSPLPGAVGIHADAANLGADKTGASSPRCRAVSEPRDSSSLPVRAVASGRQQDATGWHPSSSLPIRAATSASKSTPLNARTLRTAVLERNRERSRGQSESPVTNQPKPPGKTSPLQPAAPPPPPPPNSVGCHPEQELLAKDEQSPPTSTQAFLLSHFDDLFPSTSQAERELELDEPESLEIEKKAASPSSPDSPPHRQCMQEEAPAEDEKMPPTSTQLFLLSNFEELFPSTSQVERELELEGSSVPHKAEAEKALEPSQATFVSSQDLVMSTQDIQELDWAAASDDGSDAGGGEPATVIGDAPDVVSTAHTMDTDVTIAQDLELFASQLDDMMDGDLDWSQKKDEGKDVVDSGLGMNAGMCRGTQGKGGLLLTPEKNGAANLPPSSSYLQALELMARFIEDDDEPY